MYLTYCECRGPQIHRFCNRSMGLKIGVGGIFYHTWVTLVLNSKDHVILHKATANTPLRVRTDTAFETVTNLYWIQTSLTRVAQNHART